MESIKFKDNHRQRCPHCHDAMGVARISCTSCNAEYHPECVSEGDIVYCHSCDTENCFGDFDELKTSLDSLLSSPPKKVGRRNTTHTKGRTQAKYSEKPEVKISTSELEEILNSLTTSDYEIYSIFFEASGKKVIDASKCMHQDMKNLQKDYELIVKKAHDYPLIGLGACGLVWLAEILYIKPYFDLNLILPTMLMCISQYMPFTALSFLNCHKANEIDKSKQNLILHYENLRSNLTELFETKEAKATHILFNDDKFYERVCQNVPEARHSTIRIRNSLNKLTDLYELCQKELDYTPPSLNSGTNSTGPR